MTRTPHTAVLTALAGARRLRRGVALLACLAVFGWTLLSAAHWHDHEDAGTRGHAESACVLCLAMPTGATPPQYSLLPVLVPQAGAMPVAVTTAEPVASPVSFYLSRGPPAA